MKLMLVGVMMLGGVVLTGCGASPVVLTDTKGNVNAVIYPPSPVTVHVELKTGRGGYRSHRRDACRICRNVVVGYSCKFRRDGSKYCRERTRRVCDEYSAAVCRRR